MATTQTATALFSALAVSAMAAAGAAGEGPALRRDPGVAPWSQRHEVRVNSFTASEQASAGLAAAADGGLAVVWESRRQQQGSYGVYLQRFAPDGRPLDGETQVNLYERSMQQNPAVAADGQGGWWIAWESFGQDGSGWAVIARHFDATGQGGDERLISETVAGDQTNVVVTGDGQGGALFVWTTPRPGQPACTQVVGRRFDAEGEPASAEFRLSRRETGSENLPAVARTDAGRPVVVWAVAGDDGRPRAIHGRVLQRDGAPLTGELQLTESDSRQSIEPAVTRGPDGGFVVAWLSAHGDDYEVMLRRFRQDGLPAGPTQPLRMPGLRQRSGVAVAADAATGRCCVAVNACAEAGAKGDDIFARWFAADGTPTSEWLPLSAAHPGMQRLAAARGKQRVAWVGADRLCAVWAGDTGLGDASGVALTVLAGSSDQYALASPADRPGAPVVHLAADAAAPRPHIPPVYDPATIPSSPNGGDLEPTSPPTRDFGFLGIVNTGWNPPDPHLAAGPMNLVAMTNGAIAFFQKDGVKVFQDEIEGSYGFWSYVGPTHFVFDPEVIWDPHSQRFFAMACERTDSSGNGDSYFLLAVSASSDATGAWHRYRLDVTGLAGGGDIDSPNIAVDEQAVYLTSDHFSPDQYLVYILDKEPLLVGQPPSSRYLLITGSQSYGLPITYDAGAPAQYMLEAFEASSNSAVRIHAITDPLGTPQRQTVDVTVPAYTMPEDPPQRGTSVRPELFEARFWSCVYRNGSLWAVHHQGSGRVLARWYEFALNGWPSGGTPTLVQYGTIDPGAGIRTFFPSIWVDEFGTAAVVYARSSSTEYISIERVIHLAADPPGVMGTPARLKDSLGPDTSGRWGDYSATVTDPAQPSTFWVHHEYTPTGSSWNTWIAEVVPAALQLSLVSDVPATHPARQPLTVTLNIADGAELFEPGTAMLHYRMVPEGDFTTVPLADLGGGTFQGTLPGAFCGQHPELGFSAQGDGGTLVYDPADFPTTVHSFTPGLTQVMLDDDFETDQGWSATYVPGSGTPTGFWERVDPNGTTAAPEDDYSTDGTQCYVTEDGLPGGADGAADVDNGTFYLTSPSLDCSAGAEVRYARWFYWGGNGVEDYLDVELSNDDGANWTLVERVQGTTGWVEQVIEVGDYVTPTATVRLRFVTGDDPNDSLTEAAVDEVLVSSFSCDTCPFFGDLTEDCRLDLADWNLAADCLTGPTGTLLPGCDCLDANGDGHVDMLDVTRLQNEFTGSAGTIPGCS